MYRVGQVVADLGWVEFDLDIHHLAQLHSQFCQTSISPSRTGQVMESLKSKSTQPRSVTTNPTLYHVCDVNVLTKTVHFEIYPPSLTDSRL